MLAVLQSTTIFFFSSCFRVEIAPLPCYRFLCLCVSPPQPALPALRVYAAMVTVGQFSLSPAPTRALGRALPLPPWAWGPLLGRGPARAGGGSRRAVPPRGGGSGRLGRAPCGSCRRSRAMGSKSFLLGVLTLAVLLLAAASEGAEPPLSCEAVRKVFQLRRLGPLGGVPESPRAGKAELAGQEAPGAAGLNLVLVADLGPSGTSGPPFLHSDIGAGPLLRRENALNELWALEHPDSLPKTPLCPPTSTPYRQSVGHRGSSRPWASTGTSVTARALEAGDSHRAASGAAGVLCCETRMAQHRCKYLGCTFFLLGICPSLECNGIKFPGKWRLCCNLSISTICVNHDFYFFF